jgi:hypothetical protein
MAKAITMATRHSNMYGGKIGFLSSIALQTPLFGLRPYHITIQ